MKTAENEATVYFNNKIEMIKVPFQHARQSVVEPVQSVLWWGKVCLIVGTFALILSGAVYIHLRVVRPFFSICRPRRK
jgi:hypothetical protein